MNTVHAHTEIDLPALNALFPADVQLLMPCADGMPTKAPHLLIVRGHGDFAYLQTLVREAETATGGSVISLPHPRDTKALSDKHIAALQKHLPGIKKGHAMKDALSLAFAICPSPTLDPDLFCV